MPFLSPSLTARLSLLDGFELVLDGAPAPLRSEPARLLLAYLALRPDGRERRSRLAAMLWEEKDDALARQNLRQTLHVLRSALGSARDLVGADKQFVALGHGGLATDCADLVAAVEAGDVPAILLRRGRLHEAILTAVEPPGEIFHSWLSLHRADYETRLRTALERIVALGLDSSAQQAAHALLKLDPADESASRYLIGRYAAIGDRARAMRIYQELWNHLDEVYDSEPSPETQALLVGLKVDGPPTPPPRPQAPADASALRVGVCLEVDPRAEDEARFMVKTFQSELIVQLAKFRELETVDLTVATLPVDFTLSLSAASTGGSVLIVARLVQTEGGAVVWSDTLEGVARNWWALQARLAGRIATSCNIGATRARLLSISRTAKVERAVDLWLLGQRCMREAEPGGWRAAEKHFRGAIRLDPEFSAAYSSLAQLQNGLHLVRPGVIRSPETHRESKSFANRAVELDPADSRAHLHRGWACALLGEHDQAAASFGMALRCNANDPWTLMSAALGTAFGDDLDLSFELMNRCVEEGWATGRLHWGYRATILFLAGDDDGCVAAARNVDASLINFPAWEAAALWRLGDRRRAASRWVAFERVARERWDAPSPATT